MLTSARLEVQSVWMHWGALYARRPGAVWALACAASFGLFAASGVWAWASAGEARHLARQAALLRERAERTLSPRPLPPVAGADFTEALPSRPDLRPVVADLERLAREDSLELGDLGSQSRPASADTLGLVELTVQVRGNYPQIKRMVDEVRARHSNVTVRRISLRRAAVGTAAEGTVSFGLWGRPLPVSASSPRGDR